MVWNSNRKQSLKVGKIMKDGLRSSKLEQGWYHGISYTLWLLGMGKGWESLSMFGLPR